jgi:hypothetical protein
MIRFCTGALLYRAWPESAENAVRRPDTAATRKLGYIIWFENADLNVLLFKRDKKSKKQLGQKRATPYKIGCKTIREQAVHENFTHRRKPAVRNMLAYNIIVSPQEERRDSTV